MRRTADSPSHCKMINHMEEALRSHSQQAQRTADRRFSGTTSFLQRVLVQVPICKFQSYLLASSFNYPPSIDAFENTCDKRCIYTSNYTQSTSLITYPQSDTSGE